MGLFSTLVTQVVVTSVVLGALKHKGVLSIKPDAIKNESARYAFTQAVYGGEAAAIMAAKFYESLMSEVKK